MLCRVILRRFDVREGREEGRGAPYLAAAALLSMAESWNLLEQPMIFLQQKARYPLSVLLSRLPETEPAQKLFAGLFCCRCWPFLAGAVLAEGTPPMRKINCQPTDKAAFTKRGDFARPLRRQRRCATIKL